MTLRGARLDERSDNSHTLIAVFVRTHAGLWILDGSSAVDEIVVVIVGNAVQQQDGACSEPWLLPD